LPRSSRPREALAELLQIIISFDGLVHALVALELVESHAGLVHSVLGNRLGQPVVHPVRLRLALLDGDGL